MRALQPGSYWLGLFEDLCVYNLNQSFVPPCELNVLLQDPLLADRLYVAELRNKTRNFPVKHQNLGIAVADSYLDFIHSPNPIFLRQNP